MGGQCHAPAALPPAKTRYPLYRRLGGHQGRSGQVRKISHPTGIRFPDRLARNESLYRLNCVFNVFYVFMYLVYLYIFNVFYVFMYFMYLYILFIYICFMYLYILCIYIFYVFCVFMYFMYLYILQLSAERLRFQDNKN